MLTVTTLASFTATPETLFIDPSHLDEDVVVLRNATTTVARKAPSLAAHIRSCRQLQETEHVAQRDSPRISAAARIEVGVLRREFPAMQPVDGEQG